MTKEEQQALFRQQNEREIHGSGESHEQDWCKELEAKIAQEKEDAERRAAEAEARRAEEIEKVEKMSTAEYAAYRAGKEYTAPEDLGSLSMEDYIKARSGKV